MTRLPSPGDNKTRLIPTLGPLGATALHAHLARLTISHATSYCTSHPSTRLTIHLTGGTPAQGREWLGSDTLHILTQPPGDLGHRMAHAASTALSDHPGPLIIIGTDCPSLDQTTLTAAFTALGQTDIVLGPATDGGYYLIGMRKFSPTLFHTIPWSTPTVLTHTIAAATSAHLTFSLLPTLSDIDTPADLTPALLSLLNR